MPNNLDDILNKAFGVAQKLSDKVDVRTNPDDGFELDPVLLASDLAHETMLAMPDTELPNYDLNEE